MEQTSEGFASITTRQISVPSDFLDAVACQPIERDGLILLLTFFELLGLQEQPAVVIGKFVLADALSPRFGGDESRLEAALNSALESGFLISFRNPGEGGNANIYFLPGTPAGRELSEKLHRGEVRIQDLAAALPLPEQNRPNIYLLYEANIGPLTPIVADMLKQAEKDYPLEWIQEAIKEALEHNVRKWKYIQAILANWKEKGHGSNHEKDESNLEEFRRLYQTHKPRTGK